MYEQKSVMMGSRPLVAIGYETEHKRRFEFDGKEMPLLLLGMLSRVSSHCID
jgi:hypothetical protein